MRELLSRALDLAPSQRRAFLEARLPVGATLEDAIGLLEEVEGLDDFLEQPLESSPQVFRPALPERIGRYPIERVLGWGSMGVVYLARQTSPERAVALKVLRLDCAGPATADRFQRESQLLARLAHPGIATVFEAGVADLGTGEQPWFAMEYVDGESLSVHAQGAGLDRRGRVELVLEAARAVQHAHEEGVVHRDLKPENVLVRRSGSVCVLDFGVAQCAAETETLLTLTATGQVVGTLSYMAPEQARGGEVDARADQFALGAMLYELLTGELPLSVQGRLPHDALRIVADGSWTPPTRHDAGLAGDLEAILGTALAPEANRRYPSVGALADDLQRWLEGRPVHARPPSTLDGVWRFVRRNRVLVGATSVALLLIGGLLAFAVQALFDLERESDVALLFSDQALLAELERRADELWPTSTERVTEFDEWLRSARWLEARLLEQRAALARIAAAGGGRRGDVGGVLGDDWLVAGGQALLESIEGFLGRDGLMAEVESRRAIAASLRERTVEGWREGWRLVARRVREDPRFLGLELPPQEGLVPLGPDPESGLEEFALFTTGDLPRRNPGTRRVLPRVGDAITLVLIPGGDRLLGGQYYDQELPNYCSPLDTLQGHECYPFEVHLDPFLIGKFELNQDQWTRLFGRNPSEWEVGTTIVDVKVSPLHPVETVTWQEALELLARVGLTLPTEAQWEVAARGDSPFARIAGPLWTDLECHVSWNTHDPERQPAILPVVDDEHHTHMPVGSLAPNPYGLHDVLGNVWELCLDNYKIDNWLHDHRAGDGLILVEPDGDVSQRGCGNAMTPDYVHVYRRQVKRFDGNGATTGVRPARALRLTDSDDSRPSETSSGD